MAMPSKKQVKKPTKIRAKVEHNTYVNVNSLKADELKDFFQYLASPRSIMWTNFLAGTFRGLGFILGTVVVLAITTFIVSQVLSQIPWVGELFRWTDDWLKENIDTYGLT